MLWFLKYLTLHASYDSFGDDKILSVSDQAIMMRVPVQFVGRLDEMTFTREVCDLDGGCSRSS